MFSSSGQMRVTTWCRVRNCIYLFFFGMGCFFLVASVVQLSRFQVFFFSSSSGPHCFWVTVKQKRGEVGIVIESQVHILIAEALVLCGFEQQGSPYCTVSPLQSLQY